MKSKSTQTKATPLKSEKKAIREASLIKKFYQIKKKLGKTPSIKEFTDHSVYYRSSVTRPFGNWNLFLKHLGEETIRGRRKHVTEWSYLEEQFLAFIRKHKREPTCTEFLLLVDVIYAVLARQFGGWKDMVVKLRKGTKRR